MKTGFFFLALCHFSLSFASYQVIEDQNTLEIKTLSLQDISRRKIALDNGIKILVISDPKATESALAIGVNCGKFHDPRDYPGTAHFLEHMVLIASEKYPEENEISAYIDDNGGSHNAWTSFDYTMYGASIKHEALPGLTDRFAAIFISPLLSESATRREFKAVDSEFTNYCNSDGRRFLRILEETSEPNHPMNKFGTGNAETLSHIPLSTLRSWFEDHYSAENMVICLYSNASLDELSTIASESFSGIPVRKKVENHFAPFLSSRQKGHLIEIESIQDIRNYSFVWELPLKATDHNDTYMASMIANALSCRVKGSLYDRLISEHLIENIQCATSAFSQDHVLFFIDIDLTETGMQSIDKVTDTVFQYLNTYRSKPFPYHYYKERKAMSEISFAFQSRPSDYFRSTMQTCTELLEEEIATYPENTYSIKEYDTKTIDQVLKTLTPENGATFLMAQRGPTYKYQKIEPYIKIPYSVKPLSKQRIAYLSTLPPCDSDVFPKENSYLPSHLSLVEKSQTYKQIDRPALLVHNDDGILYYQQDDLFYTPETYYKLGVKTPLIDSTPKSKVLFDLFLSGTSEKLSDQNSYAGNAGLSCSCDENKETLILSFYGYSEKLPLYVENTLVAMKGLKWNEADFKRYKEQIKLEYQNMQQVLPYQLAKESMLSLCYSDKPTSIEKLKALEKLNLADLNQFAAGLFSKAYLKALISGNITDEGASQLFKVTKNALKFDVYPPKKHHYSKLALFPKNKNPVSINLTSTQLGFSATLLIQGDAYTPEKMGCQMVLNNVIGSDFFNELRTKQQTGYINHSSGLLWNQTLHQIFIVQSPTYSPNELLSRFELYMENFLRNFDETISEERFIHLKESVISDLNQPDNNLSDRVDRLFALAFEYQEDFDRRKKIIDSLNSLSYATFKEETASVLSRQNKKRLAILVEGVPPKAEDDFNYKTSTYEVASQMVEFGSETLL